MKKIFKKVLITVLIVLMLNNFLLSNFNVVHANVILLDISDVVEFINGLIGTVVGIFFWPLKGLALGAAVAADELIGIVAYSQGKITESGEVTDSDLFNAITPFDILFNKTAITDINFFNLSFGIAGKDGNVLQDIRISIAQWYYIMRNIAAAILLVILIYIGIRMAITTIASEKAMYKKMLWDWACSLALIFLLQYIALFIITINDSLVKLVEGASNLNSDELKNMFGEIKKEAFWGPDLYSYAATAIYCMLVIQTLSLLISYFSRMLKIAFLIIISPLITLTYSIDKIGDGKAQALGNWLKEFTFTILIQPFHCIMYAAFIPICIKITSVKGTLTQVGSVNYLAGGIIAMLCLRFTKEAENLVQKIFGIKTNDNAGSLAGGMAMSAAAYGMAKNIGKGTRTAVNKIGSSRETIASTGRQIAATAMALRAERDERIATGGETETSFESRRAAALEELNNNAEAKRLEKENRKYNTKATAQTASQINAKADEIMQRNEEDRARVEKENKGKKENEEKKALPERLTRSQAMARARLEAAQEHRRSIDADDSAVRKGVGSAIKRTISGFTGNGELAKSVSEIGKAIASSDTLRVMRNMYISGAAGLFTGASMYGTGQSFSSSLTAGMAANRGVGEFLKSSTGTLVKDINERLKSMGITDSESARIKINEIMQNGNAEKYDDPQLFKDLLKNIENALKDAGLTDKRAKDVTNSIQNTVNKEIKANPEANIQRIIGSELDKRLSGSEQGRMTGEQRQGIFDAVTGYANTRQEEELFRTMTTGTELGLDPNRLADRAYRAFVSVGGSTTDSGTEETDSDESEGKPVHDYSGDTDEELEEQRQEMNDKIAEMREELEQREKDLQDAEDDISISEEDLKALVEEYNARVDSINEDITQMQTEIERLTEEIRRRAETEGEDAEDFEEDDFID